jgi:mono/diheme cytochrome c family protein
MAGLSKKSAFRAGAALPLLLGLLPLLGCDDSYPSDLAYPSRSDPLVIKPPNEDPKELDRPGQLQQWILSLPARGAVLYDPTAAVERHQLAKVNEHLTKNQFDISDEDKSAMGLTSKPDKETAKGVLEARRDFLDKRIKSIEGTMKKVGPELTKTLKDLFGTPARPQVDVKDAEKYLAVNDEPPAKTLAEGSRLYRRHCLHCHGLSGDGRGPTAPWVNPHPRDYRQGLFKFTSTPVGQGSRKARREDLLRTLKQGIEGTSMPSFALLSEQELGQLISYVIHLSMRGQVEFEVLKEVLGPDADSDTDVEELANKKLKVIWTAGWKPSFEQGIDVGNVPAYASKPHNELSPAEKKELDDSIRRGFAQFTTGKASCRSCHNDFGRANDFKPDQWGTIARPANLTAGIYRGGRRPLDLYYRIHGGINGAQMSAFDDTLKPEQIWDIVNFLHAMPYKNMLPDDVREPVYGKGKE